MKAGMRSSIRALAVALPCTAILAVATPAQATEPQMCVQVRLTGAGQDLGPDSQGRLHTRATVFLAGIPVASTRATFTPAGPPVGTVLSFTGPIVFVPNQGTARLTAQVRGTVDLSTGRFVATSTAVRGTGALAGVSGALTLRGTENLTTGAFSETIRGTLCSPDR